jgi:hypothetical protein
MKTSPYVDFLMVEWGLERCSRSIQQCMRWVLRCYPADTLLSLRREPRLQVEVFSRVPETVWAYFPIRPGQGEVNLQLKWFVQSGRLRLKDEAEILLLLGARLRHGETAEDCEGQILHHLGHVLLYLRSPESPNECADARRENALRCGWDPDRATAGRWNRHQQAGTHCRRAVPKHLSIVG